MKKLLSLCLALLLVLLMGVPSWAFAQQIYTSETLTTINDAFFTYMLALCQGEPEIDMVGTTGLIQYNDNSFTYGYNDVGVIHGGAYSQKNTVTLGMGTGLEENEDHWYMSLTFSPEASDLTIQGCGYAFMLACGQVGLQLPEDMNESSDLVWGMLDVLFSQDEIAIEMNGLVFIHKALEGGSHLLAVDSLPYYNGFYYNSIENYFVIE